MTHEMTCPICGQYIDTEEIYSDGYNKGAEDMEKAKQIIIDNICNVMNTYKEKMFNLMYLIDELSAKPNIEELRKLHYQNMDWIKDNLLINDYYDYFVKQLKAGAENDN